MLTYNTLFLNKMDFKEYNKVIRADKDYLLFLRNGKDYSKVVRGEGDEPIDYSKEYFFIEDVSGEENVLTISKNSSTEYVNVSVSTDKVNWVDLGSTESGNLTYTIPANGKLYVKGVNNRWATSSTNSRWNSINCSKSFNVCGNTMSLLYGDDFIDKIKLPKDYTFTHLFINSKIVDASKLVLPATILSVQYCYAYMFQNCKSLTVAPALPATKLTTNCYQFMFSKCISLTEAPALPATELATNCYQDMFNDCTSLTTAPVLPATKLVSWCYNVMFSGCTKLSKVTTYADDISATHCVTLWLNGVPKTGDFYNLGTATYEIDSTSGIPTGWTEHKTLE